MTRNRYNRKESRERGRTALVMVVITGALLVGTWLFSHSQTSEGELVHISLNLVLTDVGALLLAGWLVWDWARYRRGLKQSISKARANASKGGRRKKRQK